MIPWLLFYPWVMIFLVFSIFHTLWITNFHLELYQVLIMLIVFGIFSCWKHVYRVFKLLGLEEASGPLASERMFPDYGSSRSSSREDLPPKYEEVHQYPPQYEYPPEYQEAVGCSSHSKLLQPQ